MFGQKIIVDSMHKEAEQSQKDTTFKESWRTLCSQLKEHGDKNPLKRSLKTSQHVEGDLGKENKIK